MYLVLQNKCIHGEYIAFFKERTPLLCLILFSFQNYEVPCKDPYVTITLSLVHSSPFSPLLDCTIHWWERDYVSSGIFLLSSLKHICPILFLILKKHTQLNMQISCFGFILVVCENLRVFFFFNIISFFFSF